MAFDASALVLAVLGAFIVVDVQVGSGDYGQWLMVSRYYSGDEVPGYREFSAIPPIVPLLLALTRLVISDPLTALAAFKAFLALAFFLSVYAAGAVVFRDKAAGLLGAVCTFFVADRYLGLFAFGGLLQLTSIVFICLAVAAFAQAGHSLRLSMRWWILGSLAIFLAVLSHVGTGVIAILTGCTVASTAAICNRHLSWSERIKALMPLFIVFLLLAPYWFMVVLPNSTEYASNSAALYYRGPSVLWQLLEEYQPTFILLWAGLASLIAGALYEALRRRVGSYVIVAAWAAAAWGFLGVTIIGSVGTSYPRLMYPILLPLAVAVGGALLLGLKGLVTMLPGLPKVAVPVAPLALAGLILLVAGPGAAESYQREARFYEVADLAQLKSLSESLDERLPGGQAILASSGDGKWIEGLTGRETLFTLPNRFSFRDYERERSIAADALLRSTFAMTNGQFFIKYFGSDDSIPVYPWIAINHGGEYIDLVGISPADSLATSGGEPLASLGALSAHDIDWQSRDGQLAVRTVHTGERRGQQVSYTQLATLNEKHASFTLVEEIDSALPIEEMQMLVRLVPGVVPASINVQGDQADLFFPRRGKSEPHIRVTIPEGSGTLELVAEGILVQTRGSNRLEVRFSFVPTAENINDPAILPPTQLVEDYNIGAALLLEGPPLRERIARLEALGFTVERRVGPYVVMVAPNLPEPILVTRDYTASRRQKRAIDAHKRYGSGDRV